MGIFYDSTCLSPVLEVSNFDDNTMNFELPISTKLSTSLYVCVIIEENLNYVGKYIKLQDNKCLVDLIGSSLVIMKEFKS